MIERNKLKGQFKGAGSSSMLSSQIYRIERARRGRKSRLIIIIINFHDLYFFINVEKSRNLSLKMIFVVYIYVNVKNLDKEK